MCVLGIEERPIEMAGLKLGALYFGRAVFWAYRILGVSYLGVLYFGRMVFWTYNNFGVSTYFYGRGKIQSFQHPYLGKVVFVQEIES